MEELALVGAVLVFVGGGLWVGPGARHYLLHPSQQRYHPIYRPVGAVLMVLGVVLILVRV